MYHSPLSILQVRAVLQLSHFRKHMKIMVIQLRHFLYLCTSIFFAHNLLDDQFIKVPSSKNISYKNSYNSCSKYENGHFFLVGQMATLCLTSDIAACFIDWICPRRCTSYEKSLKSRFTE